MGHTPGPWDAWHMNGAGWQIGTEDQVLRVKKGDFGSYGNIASLAWTSGLGSRPGWQEREEANARLLAAAPDLLEALEAARAALAHDVPNSCWATGPLTGDLIEDLVVCPGCRALSRIDKALAKACPQEVPHAAPTAAPTDAD